MGFMSSALNGAAFLCGMGAELFGCTEKVLEAGHYAADGLRKTADGIDWATDKAQEGCRAGENHFRNRKAELKERALLSEEEQEELMKSFVNDIEKAFNMKRADSSERQGAASKYTASKIDVEKADFTPVKKKKCSKPDEKPDDFVTDMGSDTIIL